jgi:hypothetical protein
MNSRISENDLLDQLEYKLDVQVELLGWINRKRRKFNRIKELKNFMPEDFYPECIAVVENNDGTVDRYSINYLTKQRSLKSDI